MSKQINQAGIDLLKSFEGFKSAPYLDATSKPTIGYGSTYYEDGTKVAMSDDPIDEPRASQLLQNKLNQEFCPGVSKLIKVTTTDNEFSAMVCLAYNIGLGNFQQSTVIRCMNALNRDDAARAFLLWNKAGGIVMPGLVRRRKAESELFLTS